MQQKAEFPSFPGVQQTKAALLPVSQFFDGLQHEEQLAAAALLLPTVAAKSAAMDILLRTLNKRRLDRGPANVRATSSRR